MTETVPNELTGWALSLEISSSLIYVRPPNEMEHKGKSFLFLFAVGEAGHTLHEEQEAKCRVKAVFYFMVFGLLYPCN